MFTTTTARTTMTTTTLKRIRNIIGMVNVASDKCRSWRRHVCVCVSVSSHTRLILVNKYFVFRHTYSYTRAESVDYTAEHTQCHSVVYVRYTYIRFYQNSINNTCVCSYINVKTTDTPTPRRRRYRKQPVAVFLPVSVCMWRLWRCTEW